MKKIYKTTKVFASVPEVWKTISTVEGLQTFFAPECICELWPGGNFEIRFFPENEPGFRGAEGLKVLSFLPEKMLSFEWDAPPNFPEIRKERTWVVLELLPALGNETEVRLTHLGWRDGKDWDDVYDYFTSAWETIMERLTHRFIDGPFDWNDRYHSKIEKPVSNEASPSNL